MITPVITPLPISALVLSFTLTHLILLFAFVITFVTIFLVTSPKKRQILYLECGITFIASSIYILFSRSITDNHSAADVLNMLFGFSVADPIQNINIMRYVGWFFTTSMMICALCLLLALNLNTIAPMSVLVTAVVLDWIMLSFGILGETGCIDLSLSMVLGFVAFFALFYVIYDAFLQGKKNGENQVLYWTYFVLWIMYGLVYPLEKTTKTITTNILDCLAKAVFALGISLRFLM